MDVRKRILVVDDEPNIGELLVEFLEQDGHSVEWAETAEDALAAIRREPPLLLITDLRMPGMSGLQLMARARELDGELPVVIATGYGSLETAVEALRLGVDDYLAKPFDLNTLRRVVDRVLRARSLEAENARLVTELRKANRALRKSRDALQNEVASSSRDLARVNTRLRGRLRDVSLHQRIHRIGTTTDDLGPLLQEALARICRSIGAELGSILVGDPSSKGLTVAAAFGDRHAPIRQLRRPLEGGIVGLVAREGRPCRDDDRSAEHLTRRRKYRTRHFLSVPVLAGSRTLGVLSVADPISRQPFDKSTSRLLTSIGRELGILADRVLAEQAQKTSMVNTIRALVESLEAKAPYFRGHSERVAEIGVGLAGKLGFDDSEVTLLRNASYLHDVGKIGIPDRILHKEGRLSEEEMAVVREHPALGAELVRHFDFLEPSRPLIRHHHERWDGQGYPDGLAEHAIPALAAVITIADAYDAMLSARPYRRELTRDVARRELLRSAGSQFRPDFVLAFCSRRVAAVSSPAAPTSLQEELREVERTGSEGRRILPREPLSAPPSSSDQPWITKTS